MRALLLAACLTVLASQGAAARGGFGTIGGRTPAPVGSSFTFNNGAPQQEWSGVNADYFDFAAMPESNTFGMTAALRTIEYQRTADSGIKIARTWFGLDWACPAWPTTAGCPDYTTTKMLAFFNWIDAMQAAGINVALEATGWWWPDAICDQTVTGCTPTPAQETTWAATVSSSLGYLINTRGYTNIVALAVFTEPEDNLGSNFPATYTSLTYYEHVASVVRAKIAADDAGRTPVLPRVQVLATMSHNGSATVGADNNWLVPFKAAVPGVADTYTFHIYCTTPPFAPYSMTISNCSGYSNLVTAYTSFVADASPSPLWADEAGADLTTAGSNFSQYRNTADYISILTRDLMAQVNSGYGAMFIWTLQGAHLVITTQPAAYQDWGLYPFTGSSIDARPAAYAWQLFARTMNGGTGTKIYSTTANDSTGSMHGVSVKTAANDYTFILQNESAVPRIGSWSFATPLGAARTFYRYTINGANTPHGTATQPWHAVAYEGSFSITAGIGISTIPARSVVAWSTVNLGAPLAGSTNLAATGTVTASSLAAGFTSSRLIDGDTTHFTGAAFGWQPLAAPVGTQTATIDLGATRTVTRIEVDLAGTVAPLWYADNATTASPAPLDTFTVQKWNGSTWVDFSPAINVASNTQLHRTFTVASTSTAKLQVGVPSGTTAQINEVQAFNDTSTPDTALELYGATDTTSSGSKTDTEQIAATAYTFVAGDTLEYDVFLRDNKARAGSIDITIDTGCSDTELRNVAGFTDSAARTGCCTADLSAVAFGAWYHRVVTIPACAVGHVAQKVSLVTSVTDRTCSDTYLTDGSTCLSGVYWGAQNTAAYDNIVIKHTGGATALTVYDNGSPGTVVQLHTSGYLTAEIRVVAK